MRPIDIDGFKKYLKRRGKASNVIEGLTKQAIIGGDLVHKKLGRSLEQLTVKELRQFVQELGGDKDAPVKKYCRAIGLYYRFLGLDKLADVASAAREEKIQGARKSFKLRDFIEVDRKHLRKLEEAGITTAEQMYAAGGSKLQRAALARKSKVPVKVIDELVGMSDLSRLSGLKAIRARLYYDAGIESMEKLATWEPEPLLAMLADFVKRTGFKGIAPLPKEVRNTVASARKLAKKPVD